jgi:hypothetical protein
MERAVNDAWADEIAFDVVVIGGSVIELHR